MSTVAKDLQADPTFGNVLIAPVEVFGIENFSDTTVTVRARCKTQPGEQHRVGREYRRRLKKAFDAEGIGPAPARA
jgi:small conductance mechanosensitive channel